jgi:DNA-binding beta-propeller fold protein YncE
VFTKYQSIKWENAMKHKIKSLLLLSVIFTILTACILPQGLIPINFGQATALPVQPMLDFVTPDFTMTEPPTATSTSTSTMIPPTMTIAVPGATPEPVVSSVWVANWMDGNTIRYDGKTLAEEATIAVGGRPMQIVVQPDVVWAADTTQNQILRINPSDNQVETIITIDSMEVQTLAVGEGAVWVGVREAVEAPAEGEEVETDVNLSGGVVRINPDGNEIDEYIETGAPVTDIAFQDGMVWVVSTGNDFSTIYKIDSATNELEDIGDFGIWDGGIKIAASQNSLWLINFTMGNTLIQLDGSTGEKLEEIDLARISGRAIDLTTTADAVWVLFDQGAVAKVDAVQRQIFSIINVSANVNEIFAQAGAVWVIGQANATVYRIDTAQNRVVGEAVTGSNMPTLTLPPTQTLSVYEACSGAPATRLHIGDRARVAMYPYENQRIRQEPSSGSAILTLFRPGTLMKILEGPVCANGWVWWKVQSYTSGDIGWTAEGDSDSYWLEPVE